MTSQASTAKLGIIAGGGVLPGQLVAACKAEGRPYYLLGLTGFADATALGREPDSWIRLGEAGKAFEVLRAANVGAVVMAGTVRRPSLAELRPDARTAAFFARIAGRALGDDGLLRAVIAEVEREGFTVVGPDDILQALIAKVGALGRHQPDAAAETDIAVGTKAALSLGRQDIGQAVVVRDGTVIGMEDQTGTAALMARCVTLKPSTPSGVLVKMKKPQQERRIDLPAIGPETVQQAVAAGVKGIAIEAGGGLILDADEVAAAADAAGIFVVGVPAPKDTETSVSLIYLVACEPSADQLGAALMTALRAETKGQVLFAGIGGPRMVKAGLQSLFDPSELALLGIFEVLPAFRRVLARVSQTVAHIESMKPDVLVTIDSWGFTGRVHQRLARAGSRIPRMRYVAPQVWAWRPGRAKQLARWIHHLMTLFPFEPPYFTSQGLATTWVGHPVVESGAERGDGNAFRARHGIAPDVPILCVLPGSRRSEVSRLLPVFGQALAVLKQRAREFTVVIPTVDGVADYVRTGVQAWSVPTIVVDSTEMYDAFAASRGALAASGTVSLELAMASLPHIIAYRVNALSAWAFRLLRRTRYVNMVNILMERMAVPEMLQENCTPEKLCDALLPLLVDADTRALQQRAFQAAILKLSPPDARPSQGAARTILGVIARRP